MREPVVLLDEQLRVAMHSRRSRKCSRSATTRSAATSREIGGDTGPPPRSGPAPGRRAGAASELGPRGSPAATRLLVNARRMELPTATAAVVTANDVSAEGRRARARAQPPAAGGKGGPGHRRQPRGAGGLQLLGVARPARPAAPIGGFADKLGRHRLGDRNDEVAALHQRDHHLGAADVAADRRPAGVFAAGPQRDAPAAWWTCGGRQRPRALLDANNANDHPATASSGASSRCRSWSATRTCCARSGSTRRTRSSTARSEPSVVEVFIAGWTRRPTSSRRRQRRRLRHGLRRQAVPACSSACTASASSRAPASAWLACAACCSPRRRDPRQNHARRRRPLHLHLPAPGDSKPTGPDAMTPIIRSILLTREDSPADAEIAIDALQVRRTANPSCTSRTASGARPVDGSKHAAPPRPAGGVAAGHQDAAWGGIEVLRQLAAETLQAAAGGGADLLAQGDRLTRSWDLGVNAYVVKTGGPRAVLHAVKTASSGRCSTENPNGMSERHAAHPRSRFATTRSCSASRWTIPAPIQRAAPRVVAASLTPNARRLASVAVRRPAPARLPAAPGAAAGYSAQRPACSMSELARSGATRRVSSRGGCPRIADKAALVFGPPLLRGIAGACQRQPAVAASRRGSASTRGDRLVKADRSAASRPAGVRMCAPAGRGPIRIGPIAAGRHPDQVVADVGGVEVRHHQQVGAALRGVGRSSWRSNSSHAVSAIISPSTSSFGTLLADDLVGAAHLNRAGVWWLPKLEW